MGNKARYGEEGVIGHPGVTGGATVAGYRTKLPFIIAVDFDGTLVTDKFPEIGQKNERLFQQAIGWREFGHKIILWTCRDNDTPTQELTRAVEYCREQGLEFDSVNKNIPEVIATFNNDTRKVYANLYIDDKNVIPDIDGDWEPTQFKAWKQSAVLCL